MLNGSWDVQIIDHGGLLVAAKDYHQDDEIYIMYVVNYHCRARNRNGRDVIL